MIFKDFADMAQNVADMAQDFSEEVTEIVKEDSVLKQLFDVNWPSLQEKLFQIAVSYTGRILAAIVAFIIMRWIVRHISRRMKRAMERRGNDSSVGTFLRSLISITLNVCMVLIIIWILGVKTSSLMALFASAGVAIGLALSGTLQNFAGGIIILFLKPFKIGDFIETQGQTGFVKEIQIFNTIILTRDNKTIYLPNGALSTSIMNNYSKQDKRRIDWTFSIAYGDSFEKAKAVLQELIAGDQRILTDPAPFIALSSLGDSAVNIVVQVWGQTDDYWGIFYDMNEKVYRTFADRGLNIPFPQLDVHLQQN